MYKILTLLESTPLCTVLILAALLMGCGVPVGSSSDAVHTSPLGPEDTATAASLGVDGLFAQVARTYPTFGGASIENGTLIVYITTPPSSAAQAGSVTEIRERLRGAQGMRTALQKSRSIVRRVRYGYAQLTRWRKAARPIVFASPDVRSLDIQEQSNQVVVGVRPGTPTGPLRRKLRDADIPEDAIRFEEAAVPTLTATLRDAHMPVRGGHQLEFGRSSVCTAGFNAYFGGQPAYVTASHCTHVSAAATGTVHTQGGRRIGREVFDPHRTAALSGCPPEHACRYSDVAIGRFDEAADFDYAALARPAESDSLAGPIALPPDLPAFSVQGEAAYPTHGETLHKVGRTTGWTHGQVIATCVDLRVGENTTLLCQDRVSAGVGGGDSGAPVFSVDADGVTLYGVLWGRAGNSFLFSSLHNIRADIRRAGDGQMLQTYEPIFRIPQADPDDGIDDAYTK